MIWGVTWGIIPPGGRWTNRSVAPVAACNVTNMVPVYKSVIKGRELPTKVGDSVRHLYGSVLAVGMALVMFFGGAWGYSHLLKLPVPPGQAGALPADGGSLLSNSTALLALAALVVTAVLAGMLAVIPQISPLASGLPGLLFLAWTALYLVNVRQAVKLIPLRSHAFGAGWEGLLFNGILGAVGAAMVIPLFIPSRWRRSRRAEPKAERGAEAEAFTRSVDDYPTEMTPASKAPPEFDILDGDEPLVGTVLPRQSDVAPVDTTRITGASRALRNTGSFRMATGTQPRTTGSMPRSQSAPRDSAEPYRPTRPYVE